MKMIKISERISQGEIQKEASNIKDMICSPRRSNAEFGSILERQFKIIYEFKEWYCGYQYPTQN